MNSQALIKISLTILNWFAALTGVVILCAGFSFLPALFSIDTPNTLLLHLGGLTFSKGVAGVFPFGWSIGILVIGTFLYTWICSIFSMSTHLMIVSIIHELTFGTEDGDRFAWICVACLGVVMTMFFVFILYGTLLNVLALALFLLLITVISFILVLNYTDSNGQWEEVKFYA